MLKKVMASAALATSVAGLAAATAGQAVALGDDQGTTSASGNASQSAVGNSVTEGSQSPQVGAVQGSLNKLCVGLPVKANAGSLVGVLVPVAAQDIPVLSAPQNQQCADGSTQAKGDEPASHILDDVPVLSGNGAHNG
ncbi:rodlin [Streptomyces sp. NPDC088785]|uniref:rodlin n=1 Tax=Streptomyces sp. NPDC088785 TaxID=3365897 RepID=UPI0037FB12DA